VPPYQVDSSLARNPSHCVAGLRMIFSFLRACCTPQTLPEAVLARHASPTKAELLSMAESLGLDDELLQDFIDGVDGDLQQVATMLTDQGASIASVRAQAQEAALAAADSVRCPQL
jgi:hypothetical protein